MNAPVVNGTISITAVFEGSGLYNAGVSDPALVIVSNSTLPAAQRLEELEQELDDQQVKEIGKVVVPGRLMY